MSLCLPFALTPAIGGGRGVDAAIGSLCASWGIWQRERELGTPLWAHHSSFTLDALLPLSAPSCRVSFSGVLALPHGALQRAAATCWRPPHTTNWNLDLTTLPRRTTPTQSSPFPCYQPLLPPSFFCQNVTLLNCPTYSSLCSTPPSLFFSVSLCPALAGGEKLAACDWNPSLRCPMWQINRRVPHVCLRFPLYFPT